MNVVFTCGGTGGHINPAIAVANCWKERHPEDQILFIGSKGRMEEDLVPQAGFAIETIEAKGISRSLSLAGIKQNIQAITYVLQSVGKCKKILQTFGADIVVGTGGFASFPALMAASLLKIPTCVHEANAMPGLTTRMIAKRADKVLTCFADSAKYYNDPAKVETVGMPVRDAFVFTKREDARKELGLTEELLVVSAFGSQGAKAMNEAVSELLVLEQQAGFPFHHIHATGSYGWEWMPDRVKALGVDLEKAPMITLQEYIYNMPTLMAAADVIISRAGASSCNEIAAAGTPCILIPSPNVTDDHQTKNAKALADHGAAVLLPETECTPARLMAEIQKLLDSEASRKEMKRALHKICVPDSAQRVCDIMQTLITER